MKWLMKFNPRRRPRRHLHFLAILCGPFLGIHGEVRAQVALYDNTNIELRSGERISPFSGPHDGAVAQPFNMGSHRSISSVSVAMSLVGSPEGKVEASIWDDSGNGVPGQELASLGSVNMSDLSDIGESPTTLPIVTFDAPVQGLTPEATYFLVLEEQLAAPVSRTNTFLKGALFANAGTNDVGELLLTNPPNSRNFDTSTNIFGARWLQMSVVASLLGDFDGDGALSAADIDLLSSEMGGADLDFDTNADGIIDINDHEHWVTSPDYANTFLGDVNLDGVVDFPDFLALSAGFGNSGGWAEGDFDGNGQVEFPDFLALSANYGESANAAAAVPEPNSLLLLMASLAAVARRRQERP